MRFESTLLTTLGLASFFVQPTYSWDLPARYAFTVTLGLDFRQPVLIGNSTAISGAIVNGTIAGPVANGSITGGTIQFVQVETPSGPSVRQQTQVIGEMSDGIGFSISELNAQPVKARIARAEFEIGGSYAWLNQEFIVCYSTDSSGIARCYILGEP